MSEVRPVAAGKKPPDHDPERVCLAWSFLRAIPHRGYVLVSSLYFVLVARLSASHLVLLGTAMAVTLLLCDIPVGAFADTVGRRWALVLGHAVLAASMVITGVITTFPALLATQLLWGGGWALLIGADVAWVTDELDRPDRIGQLLATAGQRELAGGASGIIAFGLVGWAAGLRIAVVASGAAMGLVGVFVALRFTERRFSPTREHRWRAMVSVLRRALGIARRDREILVVLAATALINGAAMVNWLFPKRLASLGFPANPALWYGGLGILGYAFGAPALRLLAADSDAVGVRRVYAVSCGVAACGLVLVAMAPDAYVAGVGILLTSAVGFGVARTASVIWVNTRTDSSVRATMLSLLSQAETVGEIVTGFALSLLAARAGVSHTFISSAGLATIAGVLIVALGGRTAPRRSSVS